MKGAAYATTNIGTVGGIIHYSADFTTSEPVVTDTNSSCRRRALPDPLQPLSAFPVTPRAGVSI